ncbi:MAG: hypothetical protein KGK08_14450, partial [Acidobacteriota bacterium]|nr:hypothetical protein [Acidobacteriota bacterium]
SPTFVWQSGLPFTLGFSGCGADVPGSAPCQVNGNAGSLKTGLKGFAGGPSGVTFFTQTPIGTTFTDPGLDNIGNVGRNTAFGPHLFNADMSLSKNFTFVERYTLQLRMDAYNAFNHINYGNPNGNVDTGGSIGGGPYPASLSGTTNPRQLQFTAHVQF